jgi:glycosyltransferase involved in cell wall biosynthesis
MKLHVVIPVFNEEPNVDGLLEGVRERLEPLGIRYRIVVVDDGSTDGTAARCRGASRADSEIAVVSHGVNRGPGAAFLTGFLEVLKDADALDVVVTMEGDRTSDAGILARLLHRIWEEGDEVVLASCYLYGGGIKGTDLHRVGLSHIANGLIKKTLGLSGLATLSSFYRAYQVSALRKLRARYGDQFIKSHGFECMVEILYRAAQLKLRISEVPMVLDGSRRAGKSKMKIMKTSIAYLRLIAQAKLGRL